MTAVLVCFLRFGLTRSHGQESGDGKATVPSHTAPEFGCSGVERADLSQTFQNLRFRRCTKRAATAPVLARSPSCGPSNIAVLPLGMCAGCSRERPTEENHRTLLLKGSEHCGLKQ